MEKQLTTSGIPMYKFPKCRLTECIEFVCPAIDCTLTADLDPSLLSIIVWQLTGVKPDLHITEFHADSYLDLYLRLRSAHERMKCTGKFEKEYPEKLAQAQGNVLDYVIMQLAVASGFHPEWLDKKAKTDKSLRKALNQKRQLQLSTMFKQKKSEEAQKEDYKRTSEGLQEEEDYRRGQDEEEEEEESVRRTLCLEDYSPMMELEDTVMPSAGPPEVLSPLVPPANRKRRHSEGPAQDGRGTSLPTAQDGRGASLPIIRHHAKPRLNAKSYREMDLEEQSAAVQRELRAERAEQTAQALRQHEHGNRGPGVKLSQRAEQQRQGAQLREQQFQQRLQPHQIDGDGTESIEPSLPGGDELRQAGPVAAAATAEPIPAWGE